MIEPERDRSQHQLQFVVGILGIAVLLVVSLLLAVWESTQHYRPEQINRFVQEQTGE